MSGAAGAAPEQGPLQCFEGVTYRLFWLAFNRGIGDLPAVTEENPSSVEDGFEARLAAARRAQKQEPGAGGQGGAMGMAFRLSTDLVSAVVAGGAIGWGLDWLFGTGPWLLLLFFFLGIAAGIRNVIRTATEMNAAVRADLKVEESREKDFEH